MSRQSSFHVSDDSSCPTLQEKRRRVLRQIIVLDFLWIYSISSCIEIVAKLATDGLPLVLGLRPLKELTYASGGQGYNTVVAAA